MLPRPSPTSTATLDSAILATSATGAGDSGKPVVVVTGASMGLGAAMAGRFRRGGCTVVGASRTQPAGETGHWVQMDVTDEGDRRRLVEETIQTYGRLDVLVNNAGIGMYDTWEELGSDELRRLFEVNFFSMVALTELALPQLKVQRGTVINTASVAGRAPVACMGAYCATKAAVCAYSDTLRMELEPDGVHVVNLVVGRISTGFGSRSLGKRTPPDSPSLGKATPEGLAEAVWKAWRHRRRQVIYPSWYRLVIGAARWLPGVWDRENRKRWGL